MDDLTRQEYVRQARVSKYIAHILREGFGKLDQMIYSEVLMTEEEAALLRKRYEAQIFGFDQGRERLAYKMAEEVLADSAFKQGMEEIGG